MLDSGGSVQWSTQHTLLERVADLDLTVCTLESFHNLIVDVLVQQLHHITSHHITSQE